MSDITLIDFKSAAELKKGRELDKAARNKILEKAKEKYERKQWQAAESKRKGEDIWLLPSIDAKIGNPKKKKKSKKHKKEKIQKDASSSSESEEEIWTEKKLPDTKLPVLNESAKREEWMEVPSLFKSYTRDELQIREGTHRGIKKLEEQRNKEEANKPGSHSRELNPYYQDGGVGLPATVAAPIAKNSSTSTYDAGWLRKALTRAQNQAKEKGRSLEEVAKDRWGSLDAFYALLKKAEGNTSKQEVCTSDLINNESSSYSRTSKERIHNYRNYSGSRDECCDKGTERYKREDVMKDNQRHRKKQSRGMSCRKRHHSNSSNSSTSSESIYRRRSHIQEERTKSSANYGTLLPPSDFEENSQNRSSSSFLKPENNSHKILSQRSSISTQSTYQGRWKKKDAKNELHELSNKDSDLLPKPLNDCLETSPEKVVAKEIIKSKKETKVLTDKEMNQLAARLTKAELLGNESAVAKLKLKLEKARTLREEQGKQLNVSDELEKEVVILTRTDASGFTHPIAAGKCENISQKKRNQKASKTHNAKGERTSYFPDDHKYDLKEMFEKEKNTTVEEQLAMFMKGANKEKLNEDFDVDDMFMSTIAPKESLEKQEERARKNAVLEHQRSQNSLDNCHYCLDNKLMKKHLMVSLGSKCYLSVPYHESLTEGHCMIVPIHHVSCSTRADEDLWEEVMSYRRALVQMYNERDEDCVFLEMATGLRNLPHMVIQCVPVPREVGDLAPIYFKKAIDECDEEWAQNKKLVDLKGRSVRKAVPKGLPYFWVDFGLEPGYAHVIENELKFKKNFGLEIIGGMIDADISLCRKPKAENFDTQRKKVLQFAEMFKDFEPTS